MSMLQERIELRQPRQTRGGILAAAEELPAGWESGVAFRTYGCVEPEILGPCEVGDSTEARPSDATFDPVFIRQSAGCSTIPQVGTVNIARNRLEGTTEWALGRTLAVGDLNDNPSFVDAELVGVSDSASAAEGIVAAVSCIEQAIADTAYGVEALLHAPPLLAAIIANTRLNIDGYSPMGYRWVLSPGYPAGELDSGGDFVSAIWATGTIWAGVSAVEDLNDGSTGRRPIDWRINLDAAYAQRLALVAFDPCLNLTATFVVPACIGES